MCCNKSMNDPVTKIVLQKVLTTTLRRNTNHKLAISVRTGELLLRRRSWLLQRTSATLFGYIQQEHENSGVADWPTGQSFGDNSVCELNLYKLKWVRRRKSWGSLKSLSPHSWARYLPFAVSISFNCVLSSPPRMRSTDTRVLLWHWLRSMKCSPSSNHRLIPNNHPLFISHFQHHPLPSFNLSTLYGFLE